jgi:hypothetical protein
LLVYAGKLVEIRKKETLNIPEQVWQNLLSVSCLDWPVAEESGSYHFKFIHNRIPRAHPIVANELDS